MVVFLNRCAGLPEHTSHSTCLVESNHPGSQQTPGRGFLCRVPEWQDRLCLGGAPSPPRGRFCFCFCAESTFSVASPDPLQGFHSDGRDFHLPAAVTPACRRPSAPGHPAHLERAAGLCQRPQAWPCWGLSGCASERAYLAANPKPNSPIWLLLGREPVF